jgi:hypothetical protein
MIFIIIVNVIIIFIIIIIIIIIIVDGYCQRSDGATQGSVVPAKVHLSDARGGGSVII